MAEVSVVRASHLNELASGFCVHGAASPLEATRIAHYFAPVDEFGTKMALVDLYRAIGWPMLVYCYDDDTCHRLAKSLAFDRIDAQVLRSDMSAVERQEIVEQFAGDDLRVFGEWPPGLHAAKVPLIVFYGVPRDVELYSRQVGGGTFDAAISIILALPFQVPCIDDLARKCCIQIDPMPLDVGVAKRAAYSLYLVE